MKQPPTIGRTVLYVATTEDAKEVNAHRIRTTVPEAVQRHLGSPVFEGDIYPAVVVRVHPGDKGSVNLKVQLDGNDDHWLIEVENSEEPKPGFWHWPVIADKKKEKE